MIQDPDKKSIQLLCGFLAGESKGRPHDPEIRLIDGMFFLKCRTCRSGNLVGVLRRKFVDGNSMDVAVAMRDGWREHVNPAPKHLLAALQKAEDENDCSEVYQELPKDKKKASNDIGTGAGRTFRFDL